MQQQRDRAEAGAAESGYDEKVFYDTPLLGSLVWGDLEFGKKGEGIGRKSFVSKLVSTNMTKIVNITPLLNHNEAGVFDKAHKLVDKHQQRCEQIADELEPEEFRRLLYYLIDTVLERPSETVLPVYPVEILSDSLRGMVH